MTDEQIKKLLRDKTAVIARLEAEVKAYKQAIDEREMYHLAADRYTPDDRGGLEAVRAIRDRVAELLKGGSDGRG